MTPHLSPAITLALVLIIVTFGYISACVARPFTACRRCDGTGKRPSIFGGKARRACRRCHASGLRLRTGRKIWNFFHRLHGQAHR
jgi:DnaJ-class molecular chaperone